MEQEQKHYLIALGIGWPRVMSIATLAAANFGLCKARTNTSGRYMCYSRGNSDGPYFSDNISLRPVVSLGSDVLITPSSTASDENGTAHHINW